MGDTGWVKLQRDKLVFFSSQVGSVFIDLGFLTLWLIAHHLFRRYVVDWIDPSELERKIVLGFEFLFAATTLLVIVVFLIADVKNVFMNAFERGKAEFIATKPSGESDSKKQLGKEPDKSPKEREKSNVADTSGR